MSNLSGYITIIVAIINIVRFFINRNAENKKKISDLLDLWEGETKHGKELLKKEDSIVSQDKKLDELLNATSANVGGSNEGRADNNNQG